MNDPSKQDQILAAGGLLWRRSQGGYEIALVYRARYDDWTIPKGKLKKGETWQQAALREVVEETGWQAQMGGFAGVLAYPTDRGIKVVRYWHMLAVQGSGEPPNKSEISEVAWFSIEGARQRVVYPLEKALLDAWNGPGEHP